MTSISQSDLSRILSSIDGNKSMDSCGISRREELKQKSDTRVAGWNDTLAATRKAKIEWKAKRIHDEEEKRKQQDLEEAVLCEKRRLEALAHADHLLREQKEKVRHFRSQQKLVETLDTRDSQIKAKEDRRIHEAAAEKQWHIEVMRNIQEAERKALIDVDIKARKSKKLADDLHLQRKQHVESVRMQQQCKRVEEEAMVAKNAMDDAAAEKHEAQLKHEQKVKTKQEIISNEKLLKTRKEQLQKKEQELTKKCEEEARRQNSINVARAALEQQHFKEKQNMRKILSDRASEDLRQRAEREFAIFERDQKLRNQKELEKTEAERQKQELDRILIDQSRKQQIKLKKEQLEADKELSKLYIDQLNKISRKEEELERQKEQAKKEQNIKIRAAQYQQYQENIKRKEEERLITLKQDNKVLESIKNEEDMFKEFVAREIANFKSEGKRTVLLEKTLNV